jgi:hypothetical protein
MNTSLRGVVAFSMVGLLLVAAYIFVHNWMGEHLSERVREEVLEIRSTSGSFPVSYGSSSKILGFLPGPEIGYQTSGQDCLVSFFPLPLGPRQGLECVSGERRYGP